MTNFTAELIGTMILIVLGCGINAGNSLTNSFSKNAGWISVVFGWGFAVAIAVYAVGEVSGAHINPAVTLALAVNGDLLWSEVPIYISAQVIGAILGSIIVWLQYLPHWRATQEADIKLGVFATKPAIKNTFPNLSSEIIGTFMLILGLLSIGANEFAKGINPLIVGFLIVSIGLSLGGSTGYAINPARDFGPRLAHFILPISGKGTSNWGYAWIPIIGPAIGGVYGAVFYKAFFEQHFSMLFWLMTAITLLILVISILNENRNKISD